MTRCQTTCRRDPPTREDNPFATCWTRPGAMPYLPTADGSVDKLLAAWRLADGRGQIVGPHGVGKSTLLLAAGDALEDQGWEVRSVVFGADQPSRPRPSALTDFRQATGRLLLIDGWEQLTTWRRWRLLRHCAAENVSVLATTHRATRWLPRLMTLAPTPRLISRLYHELVRERPSPVTESMALQAFEGAGCDIRETWFRLYDRHEDLIHGQAPQR